MAGYKADFSYYCIYCGKRCNVVFDFDADCFDEDKKILAGRFCRNCGSKHNILVNLEAEFRGKLKAKLSILSGVKEVKKTLLKKYEIEHERANSMARSQAAKAFSDISDSQENIEVLKAELSKLEEDYAEAEKKNNFLRSELQMLIDEEYGYEGAVGEDTVSFYNRCINASSREEQGKISEVGREMCFNPIRGTENEIAYSSAAQTCFFYVKELEEERLFELYPNIMIKTNVGQDFFLEFYDIEGEGAYVSLAAPCEVEFERNTYRIRKYGFINLRETLI